MIQSAKLMVELGADVDARAKHGVSPFQLAVWQNHLDVCKWLVRVVHGCFLFFCFHHITS
jgi:ankyrin repeat protein